MAPVRRRTSKNFTNYAATQAAEDAYDTLAERQKLGTVRFLGFIGSIAHMVKGALGGGILGSHVAYMKGGLALAIPLNIAVGVYISSCLYLLVDSAQKLYRRTRIPVMSYSDVGEASCMLFPNPKVQNLARTFRYSIDTVICLDVFGACCCYQIIIAKQIKQLVEDAEESTIQGKDGFPGLRIYLAAFIPVIILICLIRHLKYLAPFSIGANLIIELEHHVSNFSLTCSNCVTSESGANAVFAIIMTIYYCFENNPTFENLVMTTSLYGVFEYIGMAMFSMSCAAIVIPVENNITDPNKYPLALAIAMSIVITSIFLVSFFGYSAYRENSETPITLNFPMTTTPKILKFLIAVMIYVTHALNFWVPFNLCFYYLKKLHPPEKHVMAELIYRAIFVVIIGLVAIVFPQIDAIMGFIGCFCLTNMAFIWPNVICLLVIWDRPGLGPHKWRLWRGIVLSGVGVFIFIGGSIVNAASIVDVFINT